MTLSEKRKGELYIFLEVATWALFPVVTSLSYATLSPLASLLWSTVFATTFFACIIALRGRFSEMKNPLLWKYSFFITFFIGFLYYAFYFIGLAHTTAGNAAILAELEVLTAFIFFNVIRREPISSNYILGAACMLGGILVLLVRDFSALNFGDFLIIAAVICTPPANLYQQKARAIASSETILFIRSAGAAIMVFLLMRFLGVSASIGNFGAAFPILFINGVLMLGLSKIFWIEAIHRISVSKATALQVSAPAITLLVAWPLLHQTPNLWQLASLAPIVLGVLFLSDQIRFRSLQVFQNASERAETGVL